MSEEEKVTEDKESLARAHLPYEVEYCKTNRGKCKKCAKAMEKDTLKMAILTKSPWHDGYDRKFYHLTCFFEIKRPSSVAEIGRYEALKFDDQKKLEKAVESKGLSVLGSSASVETKSKGGSSKTKDEKTKGKKRGPEPVGILVNYDDFLVEYAKSSRGKCHKCEKNIDKASIRLGKLDYAAETRYNVGPIARWHHVDCFVKAQEDLMFFGQVDKIKNFSDLKEEDQKLLKKQVKPLKISLSDDSSSKKMKSEEEVAEEKLLRKQSERLFAIKEHLGKMVKKDVESMLDHMDQKSNYKTTSILHDMAADILLFGPFEKCPNCKKGRGILLRGGSYICTNGTESEPCTYESREPKRSLPDIPDEIVEKYEFFEDKYKFIGGHRKFSNSFVKAVEQKEAEDNKIVQDGAPLKGLSIGVINWKGVKLDKERVQKKVTTLGGKIQTALDKSVFIILSSEDELSQEKPKTEVAKALDVPFATADFLFEIKTKEDVVPQLEKCLIGKWKGDIKTRFETLS